MTLPIFTHPDMSGHQPGVGHPERPERLAAVLAALALQGERRMGANPHANGGLLLKDLQLPDFRDYAVKVTDPGAGQAESTRVIKIAQH